MSINHHAWCALRRLPRVGPKRFQHIIKAFGSPEAFFSASVSERARFKLSFDQADIDRVNRDAEKDIAWSKETEAQILTLADDAYPERLTVLSDAPPVLFVRGDVHLLSAPSLAVVGSRNASHEGEENAYLFSAHLAQTGIVIVSGLALGIDTKAHEGALSTGETIAVMGTGADRIYPAKNRDLAHKIVEKGALITEFPIGTPVKSHAFPQRNRIISGLTLGTLVVEATVQSGSLITANQAGDQGREVFAIPASIHNPRAKGCLQLIKQGAKLVENGDDILNELAPHLDAWIQSKPLSDNHTQAAKKADKNTFSSPESQQVWDALEHDEKSIDVLIKLTGLVANEISSVLLILELEGRVVKTPQGYRRNLSSENN